MKNKMMLVAALALCAGILTGGCASLNNPGRTDRPKEAVSQKIDTQSLVLDLALWLGPWALLGGGAGNLLGFVGLGGSIYDFATENIYQTEPSYRSKYPDNP
ncbi:MAG: hypothetical protein WC980_10195 [Candidatus Brocadiia bacterium]